MSKERPVHFPVGNDGIDDLRQGFALLRIAEAAIAAMEANLVATDIIALRAVIGDAVQYLEGADARAIEAHNKQAEIDYATLISRAGNGS
ncbi:MAG: hypothetical protein K0S00_2891 [Xanthobacteraceae bacterium]|nr:hypothetical protein [Xanthobacteraceae bacterium]